MYLPEGMEKFRIFRAGLEDFLDAGYVYIGMDHFALPGDELAIAQQNRTLHRNFQGYTTKAGADLYGMGVSAISSVGGAYAQNLKEVAAYQNTVADSRHRDRARLSAFRRTTSSPRRDWPAALPHRDSQAGNRRRIRDLL